MSFLEFLSQPWHWAVSGTMIAGAMLVLLFWGKRFGISSTLRSICAIGGAGNRFSFFRYDWKAEFWNLAFAFGAIIGGWIGIHVLGSPEPVQIAQSTQDYLATLGIMTPQSIADGYGYVPGEIFSYDSLFTLNGLIFLVLGGFLVGFGTRYAGGCTSDL